MRAVTVFLQMYPQHLQECLAHNTHWGNTKQCVYRKDNDYILPTNRFKQPQNTLFESTAFYRVSFNFGGVSS